MERGGADSTFFGVKDGEETIGANRQVAVKEKISKVGKIVIQVSTINDNFTAVCLAFDRLSKGKTKVVRFRYLQVQPSPPRHL